MDNREVIGSWLSGPRATVEEMGVDLGYRGERLGLPKEGPGSVARAGRRLAALSIDWALCLLIVFGLIAHRDWLAMGNWPLLVFLVMSVLTVGTVGFTPGKRILGIRVVSVTGGRLGILRVLLRSVLLVLVLPAVVFDRDGRGLHDRAARSVQIRF